MAAKQTVLDLGCGNKKHPDAIGIDSIKAQGVDLVHDLSKGIPYKDASVDKVYAFHIIEHLNDTVKIMQEIFRVLKPGGTLEGEVPHYTSHFYHADPTHKRGFNWYTLDYFCRGHEFNYYAGTGFEMVKKHYYVECKKFAWCRKALAAFATNHPNLYEKFLSSFYKVDGIRFEMKKP